ncbi:hypothetical protein [Hyphomicrobium sp.]|uniref:hypothetical protein n=1 Tax=Hyphomicrobium sp. TaxID=82 RepID=UPI002E361929|nr:hypothetical protein [Hyphomicrobium sp.]HEX2842845.1 hypothetical protein [Hyphomicrobium sp.]
MRKLLIVIASSGALLSAHVPGATAADATGCEGFLWPLATELSWMKASDSEATASGATLPKPPTDKAIALKLLPASQVSLSAKPTSTPQPDDAEKFAGVVTFEAPTAPGHYQVTISTHAWIDVVQNGVPLETTGHTGAKNCDSIRKSVRFEIGSGPFSIQINSAPTDTIKIAIRPAAD